MNRSFLVKVLALMLIICIALPLFASAESFKAKVYVSSMKVYASASTSGRYLGSLKKGVEIKVNATSGSWAYITYKGRNGYCQIKNIISLEHNKRAYTSKNTYVYKSASTASGKIDQLSTDYQLYLVGESGSFYLVEDFYGKFTGYVRKSSISTKRSDKYEVAAEYKTTYNSDGSSTRCPRTLRSSTNFVAKSHGSAKWAAYIAYVGQCKLGCKYVSRSANNVTTFSNYSFVQSCFRALGFTIPGSIKSVGNVPLARRISKGNLKVGDIVCFNCDKTDGDIVDHIGIYIGGGYFIHASNQAGCVVVTDMKNKYYSSAFCWGRRVL